MRHKNSPSRTQNTKQSTLQYMPNSKKRNLNGGRQLANKKQRTATMSYECLQLNTQTDLQAFKFQITCKILPKLDLSVMLTSSEMVHFGISSKPRSEGALSQRQIIRVSFKRFKRVIQRLLKVGELPVDGAPYWQFQLALERHRTRTRANSSLKRSK
jgi:hypothetical protein